MATELVNVHADLEALRKLYGLLQNSSVDGTQELDEIAKIVLKNLLDGATEKALETHTKIITAAQSSVSVAQQQFNIAPNMKKDATNCHNKYTSRDDLRRATKRPGSGTAQSKSGAHDGQQRRDRFNGFVKENEKMRESVKSSRRGKRINQVQSRVVNNIAAAAGSPVGNAMAIRRIGCGASDVDRASSRHGKGVWVARPSKCSPCHNNNNNNNNNNDNNEQQLVDQLSMKMVQKETVRLSRRRPVPSAKKKLPPPRRQVIVRPTLLESESESESESDERNGSSASASWTTQHTNTTYTESTEAKSLSGASFAYGQNGDYGSNSETDIKGSGNSYPSSPSSYSSFVTSRSRLNPKEDKPAIGRLRRLKNKLALIFHHHHHHHHHHHYDHDSDFSKVRHSHSMWKHIQNNMLHHKNKRHKNEICGKQYLTGTRCKQQQQQANYFRTLVQGLMRRQAGDSKKSKLPKGGIVVKKLHWWHMFKRRRGLKLGPKARTIKMK